MESFQIEALRADRPFLEVGIGDGHEVDQQRLRGIALIEEVAHGRLGVLALGQFAAVAVLELHDRGNMGVFGGFPAQGAEHVEVDRRGGDPFLAAGDHRRAHEMVVDDVGEMVGRQAVGLEDDDVGVVVLQFDLAADDVDELDLLLVVAIGTEADDPGGAGFDAGDAFLVAQVAVAGIDAVITGEFLSLLLHLADGVEVLRRAEIGIGASELDEFLDDGLVDIGAHRLLIGTVGTLVAVGEITLVGNDAEMGKLVDEIAFGTLDGALGVGVFQAEEIDAAAFLRGHVGDERGEQRTGVEEAGRGRREAGNLGAFGQIAGRIGLFQVGDRELDFREEKFRELFVTDHVRTSVLGAVKL